MVLRFVQISDIHFGQERDGSLPEHDDVRRQLLVDAGDIAQRRGAANLVLVVGDTAFSGKKTEYDRAGKWLDELTKAVGCAEKAVRLVPGNHDCDRDEVNTVCRMVHEKIRSGTPKSAYGHLEQIAKDSESSNPLLPKLRSYRDFAAGYESDFKSVGTPLWTKDFDFPEGFTLRLIGMNSVQLCDDQDDVGKMILGNTQYILDVDPHVIPLVLVHHPLSWFMDKAEAEAYLQNRAHLIMVGHEHIPKVNKITSGKHERVDLYAGATNPSENGALYRHTYNWIEMSIRVVNSTLTLNLEVFARAWVPDLTKFEADTPRMHGEQSLSIEVVCHQAKPRAFAKTAVENPIPAPASTAGGTTETTSVAASSSNGGDVMKVSDEDVAQLRFLFWRHLNWQQRLKVLVQADVLPASADKPLPQNMERVAIETARASGKLAAIWDAMTPFLPESKRQPNPFRNQ